VKERLYRIQYEKISKQEDFIVAKNADDALRKIKVKHKRDKYSRKQNYTATLFKK